MSYSPEQKEYYIDSFRQMLDEIEKDCASQEAQSFLLSRERQIELYDEIWIRYAENLNTDDKFAIADEEIDQFFDLTGELLQYIDDDIIMDPLVHSPSGLRLIYRNLFMWLKYHGDAEILNRRFFLEDDRLYFEQCGIRYDLSKDRKVVVRAINIRDNKFCMDLRFMLELLYQYKKDAIIAELDGQRYEVELTKYYAQEKVFGRTIDRKYTFYVEFPLPLLMDGNRHEISFYMELGDDRIKLPMDFNRAASRIHNKTITDYGYWCITDPGKEEVIAATYENDSLVIDKISQSEINQRETHIKNDGLKHIKYVHDRNVKTIKSTYPIPKRFSKIHQEGKVEKRDKQELISLRDEYFDIKRKGNFPRTWMYFDKLFKGGDNGEYAFRYAVNNDPEVESYYIINENSPDYERLTKEFGDRIIPYGSHKAKLYALLAETIVATHPDIIEFFGYGPKMTSLIKDLFNPYLVCIAHGVTIQKNADFQNRLYDNTMFYTTSSKYEVEHILKPVYGYKEDEVALTGMARFDGLVNEDKRQILITPTWRRNLVGNAERNSTREYSDEFKASNYYRIYNSLINDERIIESAKKNGYSIIFLLHPSMSTQIDDFEKNDFVKIIPASGDMSYEKILKESSLMVTDYSGIHYDFGFMRKPVIYYQPKEVPMRFEEGGMKFATMGFGPLTQDYEEAIGLICEFMDSDCKMPEEYKNRADDFFAFDDHNNCQRIHDAIKNWVEKRKKTDIEV